MSQPLPTGDYVLTNFRYLSAYNELVARISQRQQTLTLFVAIFTGLVTGLACFIAHLCLRLVHYHPGKRAKA